MSERRLALQRYSAAIALSVLVASCRNEADSAGFVQANQPAAPNTAVASTDTLNRSAKQSFSKPQSQPKPLPVETESMIIPVKLVKKGSAIKSDPPLTPLKHTKSKLVEFQSAPFPYHGTVPSTGRPFLDVSEGGSRGHRTSSGTVYLEERTYNDSRVLLHIPRGFDVRRPAIMVVFLHGHGATLQRDVIERQRVPEQVSEAGVNAVLVAPQLAFDAADSSAGKLWEHGGFQRFLEEASAELAKMHGDPRSKPIFDLSLIHI